MNRLVGAQRSLFELTALLGRSDLVDPAEIAETSEVAAAAAQALTEMASDIVAMERAADANARAREHLTSTISDAANELDSGVDQFEELVAAAARVTAPNASSTTSAGRTAELVSATDRLEGWATALAELAAIRSRTP